MATTFKVFGHSSSHRGDSGDRNEREKRDRSHKESRWGGRDGGSNQRLERDYPGDHGVDRSYEDQREYLGERNDNRGRERNDRGGEIQGEIGGFLRNDREVEERNNPLISRLRDLAGHNPIPSQNCGYQGDMPNQGWSADSIRRENEGK